MIQNQINIRNEKESDFSEVENLVREAFWNLYRPGCDEHYLVHIMRKHEDYIAKLSLIAEVDNKIVGTIQFTKSKLISKSGKEKDILTFGPLAVHPDYQRQGIGKALIGKSSGLAKEMGYEAIVIMGYPENYLSSGFKSAKSFNISILDGTYPLANLVLALKENTIKKEEWTFLESTVYHINPEDADIYDKKFPPKERKHELSQDIFDLFSHAVLIDME